MKTFCGRLSGVTCLYLVAGLMQATAADAFPLQAKRILFLGDSVTYAGQYVAWIETQLRLQGVDPLPEIINLGLSSETCSGLSEPDHPFPRPDVHERLTRALQQVRPDVVVACYGMNDGIYHPFHEDRFQAWKDGILRLTAAVRGAGAKIVLLTPPPFDPLLLRESGKLQPAGRDKYAYFAVYENYADVVKTYGDWILQLRDEADMVIDLHQPVISYVTEQRRRDPRFSLAPDGVHPTEEGQRVIAEAILRALGVESWATPDPELWRLITSRGVLLRDAWLSQVGHLRPGIAAGLPLSEAEQQAAELDRQILPLVQQARMPKTGQRQSSGGTVFEVGYPATARSGQLQVSVDYQLWIPDGVDHLRGIIVHQHGCGAGASRGGQTAADDLHWQALAAKWNCALMGSMYEPRDNINCRRWCDARNGSERQFLNAVEYFSQAAGHPELQHAPWCLWGHSGGAFWSSLMQTLHPDRIVAVWLRSGTAWSAWSKNEIARPEITAAALNVPVLANPGLKEKDDPRFHVAWDGAKAMQAEYRTLGAPFFEFAADPRTGHECGDSRYLAIPWFDFWLAHRLPAAGDTSQTLRPAAEAQHDWAVQMQPRLDEYEATGGVADRTPPPAPTSVTVTRTDDGETLISWTADADPESGIRAFVIERNGRRIAQMPETPVGKYGRPLFQAMTYHDTPELPLPLMQYIDRETPRPDQAVYQIRSVNSVELVSEPASGR